MSVQFKFDRIQKQVDFNFVPVLYINIEPNKIEKDQFLLANLITMVIHKISLILELEDIEFCSCLDLSSSLSFSCFSWESSSARS